jgi:hypothetical protein
MTLSDGTYRLKSIVQEKQYATWFASSNKIVGNDGVEPDREWAIDIVRLILETNTYGFKLTVVAVERSFSRGFHCII